MSPGDPPNPRPRRCFVISPIGPEGSEIREHADAVFDFIIAPAMAQIGCEVSRADHSSKPGRITEQMFDSILGEDLCIAVLTYANPNVYYELAVAQCAARPVVLLVLKGTPLPFDIKDLRVIEYDLKPKPLFDRVYSRAVAAAAAQLLDPSHRHAVPFGRDLAPLGAGGPAASLFEANESVATMEEWLSRFAATGERLYLGGMALSGLLQSERTIQTLADRAGGGVDVRILLSHPDNPFLPTLHPISGRDSAVTRTRATILHTARVYAQGVGHDRVRLLRDAAMTQHLVVLDHSAWATPYFVSRETRVSPTYRAAPSSGAYLAVRGEFELLWRHSLASSTPDGGIR